MHDQLSQPAIAQRLTTNAMGRAMEIHAVIDSTNTRARVLADQGAPHGFCVAAEMQNGGRGRMGRSFFSPPGVGVYVSFILRPTMPAGEAVKMTTMAAVAVARAIEQLVDVSIKIKWVNDLYLNDKKICGILCESSIDFQTGQLDYGVVGIGVNVGKIEFPDELSGIATSIYNETGRVVSPNALIGEIANQLERLCPGLQGGLYMDEYRSRSNVIGREVTVLKGSECFAAVAEGIDDQGRLVVCHDGKSEALGSGEISLKLKGVHY